MTSPRRRDIMRAAWALPTVMLVGCSDSPSSTGAPTIPPQPSLTSPPEAPARLLDGTSFVVDRARREVAGSSPDGLLVWKIGMPQPVREMRAEDGGVHGVGLDTAVLVLTDDSTTIVSPEDGAEIARHEVAEASAGEQSAPTKVAVDESGTVAVVAGGRDHELRVWDLDSGKSRQVAEDLGLVVGVALADADTALLLTHEGEGAGRLRRVSLRDGDQHGSTETADPRALAYHPGRRLVAVAGVDSPGQHSIRFVDAPGGDEVGRVADLATSPRWMAFSPDGSRLAVSDIETVAVVEVEPLTSTALPGGSDRRLGVSWLDEETLVVGGDEVFEVWDVEVGEVIGRLEAPTGD